MSVDLTGADWERLRALRAIFLRAELVGVGPSGYWNSLRDLELYDATFAQRIGWKWDAVLRELELRAALPQGATVVDWGCGTGIAARKFLGRSTGVERVFLSDRSKQARWFARDALRAQRPEVAAILHEPSAGDEVDVLLVSHVLDELDEDACAPLLALARRARAVVWVESGAQATSRKLSSVRDGLLDALDVLAPCTHRANCGALAGERNWCHFFAKPPAEAFTSAFWRRFSDELELDLRALPYSFLALARRSATDATTCGGATRFLGRPRLLKGRALLDACDESGVRELSLLERTDKRLFKRLDRAAGEPLIFDVEVDERRIIALSQRVAAP